MVIIITGATHTGKTLLAQKLLEKYHYPYLSIDHMKMGLIRSGHTSLTPSDDKELLKTGRISLLKEAISPLTGKMLLMRHIAVRYDSSALS